jgi:hypothetical protein
VWGISFELLANASYFVIAAEFRETSGLLTIWR